MCVDARKGEGKKDAGRKDGRPTCVCDSVALSPEVALGFGPHGVMLCG